MQTAGVVFALLYRQTIAEILRINCETYADFSVMHENARLSDGAFRTLLETDSETCKYECATEERCKSINFNDDENICELNAKSAEDPKDATEVNIGNGWKYYSPSYNEMLVGMNCRRGNNCRQNQKCIDVCDCPGYKCIDKYKVMTDDKLNWTSARAKCRELGGDLVSIANAEEDNALSKLVPEETWFWMGYNDREKEGNFTWSDGMPVTYSNWGLHEAFGTSKFTEDCGMIRSTGGIWAWHDASCSWIINFVCKFY